MSTICDISDLQKLARKRVPRMFYEYADSRSWSQSTYRANQADFADILLRQRVAVDITERSLATEMVGQPVGLLYPGGNVASRQLVTHALERNEFEDIAARQSIFFGQSSRGFSARARVGGLAIVNT